MSETLENEEGTYDDQVEISGACCRNDRVLDSCTGVQDLSGFLAQMGKKVLDVAGDGNCLYHAIMAAVRESLEIGEIVVGENFPENHSMMRTRLVQHLMKIKSDFLSEEKKESWKYGLQPLNEDIVSGRFERISGESWEDCLARTLDTTEWLEYAQRDTVWCSDFFLQMLVSLMVEWGVKQCDGEPVHFFYMYVAKQNEQTFLVRYECVCPIDLGQNVHSERQKISRKEERKQGDFYHNFYRKRLPAEIKMPTSGVIIIVHYLNHYCATTDVMTQDERVEKTARSVMDCVELWTPRIQKIRCQVQEIAPLYADLCFYIKKSNEQCLDIFDDFVSESRKQETGICNSHSEMRTLLFELFPFAISSKSHVLRTRKVSFPDVQRDESVDVTPPDVLSRIIGVRISNIIAKFKLVEESLTATNIALCKSLLERNKEIDDIILRNTSDTNLDLLSRGMKSLCLVNAIAIIYEKKTEAISETLVILQHYFFKKDVTNEAGQASALAKRSSDSVDSVRGKKL